MSQHGRFQSRMGGEPRLMGGPPPAVGTISGAAGPMSVMTPNFYRGSKRGPIGGAAGRVMGNISKLARSATVDGPEARQTHDMPENQPIVVKRKIAQNDVMYSQESNLQYYPVWLHPAIDEYYGPTDYSREGRDGYHKRLLVDMQSGVEHHALTHTQRSVGGRTKFLYWHASLAELNYIFQAKEDVGTKGRGIRKKDRSIAEVLGDWSFDGVIDNKKHNYDKYGKWNSTGDDAYVTVVQFNLAHVVNYWGSNAVAGVSLFFIFKRVDRSTLPQKPNGYVMGVTKHMIKSATPEKTVADDEVEGADLLGLVRKPFQIFPWAKMGYEQPPMSVLEYVDNNGIPRIASYRKVGVVHRGSSKVVKRAYIDRARYDDYAAMQLSRIWVFLGI